MSFQIFNNRSERLGLFLARHHNVISFIVIALFVIVVGAFCVGSGALTSMD